MGNSTGSMFYLFAIVIVVYIVGASIYQVFLWFKKWQEKKNDEKFSMDNGRAQRIEELRNGRYYCYINCNCSSWICAKRSSKCISKVTALVVAEELALLKQMIKN